MNYEVFTNRNKMKIDEANTIKSNCNMSKKLLLALYIAMLAGIATAQVSKTVNCTTAGTLYTLLTKPEYTTITNLTVTGNIDVRDVHFMRDSMTVLAVLNLEAAQIKAYGTSAANVMPDSSFYQKANLTSIQLPSSLIAVGDYAFNHCSGFTGNLTIPNSMTSIGKYAFTYCSGFTGNLIIPSSVTSIGEGAFGACGFTGSLIIPNSVTSIGGYAFYMCGYFTGNLTIPDSLTSIGEWTFCSCGFTGNLTIPNSVISIGNFSFASCAFTGNLIIPNSITSIEDNAFNNCRNLQKITVGIVVPLTITANTFYNVNKTTCELAVPKGSKAAYQAADYWKDFVNITESIFVFFNSQGGSAVGYIISKSDTIIAEPTAPTKTGFTFVGWYKEADCTNAWTFASDVVTADTTLYAKWTINIYTVSFNSQGGSAVADLTANYNTTITAPSAPTQTGCTFAGWYKEAACTNAWTFATDVIASNTTLYAKWNINSYTVSFNSQGGSAVADLTANYNTAIAMPTAPTKTGFIFAGWYKEAACTNAWTFATDVVIANTTLYAKWTGSTSIRDNTSASEINLYPNPATDYLILKIEGKVQTQCIASLYDINGQLLMTQKVENNETSIVMSNLVPATYFLKVAQTKHASSQQQIKTFKIIKK